MEFHPFADVFPLLDEVRLDELARDIADNGLREPILLFESKILDGRNRWLACQRAGVTPEMTRAPVAGRDQALRLAISLNVHRRHLTEAQRAMAALAVLPLFEEIAAERRKATQNNNAARAECAPGHTQVSYSIPPAFSPALPPALPPRETAPPKEAPPKASSKVVFGKLEPAPAPSAPIPGAYALPPAPPPRGTPEHAAWAAATRPRRAADDAAEAFDVSARSVARAKVVDEHGAPELAAAVRQGHVGLKPAAAVAREPEDVQREVVRRVVEEDAKPADALREVKTPHVANNSGDNEWYTPAGYIDSARRVLGRIDLDPASCVHANETVRAETYYTSYEDGLAHEWHGLVWLNPPYEDGLVGQFAAKLVEEYTSGNTVEAIALVNNATETKWFQALAEVATAGCLVKGRIRFLKSDGVRNTPLQGQVFLYFGTKPDIFCEVFRAEGVCWVKPRGYA